MPKRKCCCSNSDQCSDIQNRLEALGASHMYGHHEITIVLDYRVLPVKLTAVLILDHF